VSDNKNSYYFVWFRVLFNARFYYPIFTVFFLDHGLSLEQFALLNTVWAVSIVLLEVPSGALADIVGRKRLVVGASCLMLLEMLCLLLVPPHSQWVFWIFALNRILSGAAEASASGADEALAYDSLPEEGREKLWAQIMAKTMRWQAVGFVLAMVLGGVFYDAEVLNQFIQNLGLNFNVSKTLSMKLPILLCVFSSLACIFVSLKMKDTLKTTSLKLSECFNAGKEAFSTTLKAGGWILRSKHVFSILMFALVIDSVIRMFMTLNSEYYRSLGFTEASFGVIGACMGLMGFVVPSVGEWIASFASRKKVALLLVILTSIGLWGVQASFVKPMLFFAFLLSATMSLLGYFSSLYLNKEAPAKMRATVLSFKGLSFNLAYGSLGILYSLLVAQIRGDSQSGQVFEGALSYFAPFFLLSVVFAFGLSFWQRRFLGKKGAD